MCWVSTVEHRASLVAAHRLSCSTVCGISVPQTSGRTCVPCSGRQILNYWTTREVPPAIPLTKPCGQIPGQSIPPLTHTLPGKKLSETGLSLTSVGDFCVPVTEKSQVSFHLSFYWREKKVYVCMCVVFGTAEKIFLAFSNAHLI